MSKFVNTQYVDSLNSLTDGFKNKLNNPYYMHTDKKPVVTTYYNQDIKASSLDNALLISYSDRSSESPIRYNKIENACLYGAYQLIVDIDNTDWGVVSNTIEGELIVLPNTFEPIENDYFYINSITEQTLMFKVISVDVNTIENGANLYKIGFKLETRENTIEPLVNKKFKMLINNVGTQNKCIIEENDYDYILNIDKALILLKDYYKDLFYKQIVQSFIFSYNSNYFYDPFLIEFIKRNKILEGGTNYLFVAHQIGLPATFVLDYDRTFFRSLELKNKNLSRTSSIGKYIDEPYSLFYCRLEDYFAINYIDDSYIDMQKGNINNVRLDLIQNIANNILFTDEKEKYMNIIVKYFNDIKLSPDDIESIEMIDFGTNIELFYNIPMVIYALEYWVNKLLH